MRYEDLAGGRVAVTRQTSAFISEDFQPQMIQMQVVPEHASGNSSFGALAPSTISTKPTGPDRTALAPTVTPNP